MTTSRFDKFVLWVMLVATLWSPNDQNSTSELFVLARYAIFLAGSGYFILQALNKSSFVIPLTLESVFLILFLLYTALSSLWGFGGPDTYLKSMFVLTTLLLGLSVAYTMPLRSILEVWFSALALFVVLGVFVALVFPSIGVDSSWSHAGKWHGLSGQKNAFGANAAQSFIAALCLQLSHSGTHQSMRWALIRRASYLVISLTAVIMAGSRGSQLMVLVGLCAIAFVYAPRILRLGALVTGVSLALPLLVLIAITFEIDQGVISLLGVSVDTSSRTLIWGYGFEQFSGREVFGFGIGGFWSEARLAEFKDTHGWVLDNFHNGYISVLIQGGIVGLTLVLCALFANLFFLNSGLDQKRDRNLMLVFAFFMTFLVSNLHENSLARSTEPTLVVFIITCFAIRPYIYGRTATLNARRAAQTNHSALWQN